MVVVRSVMEVKKEVKIEDAIRVEGRKRFGSPLVKLPARNRFKWHTKLRIVSGCAATVVLLFLIVGVGVRLHQDRVAILLLSEQLKNLQLDVDFCKYYIAEANQYNEQFYAAKLNASINLFREQMSSHTQNKETTVDTASTATTRNGRFARQTSGEQQTRHKKQQIAAHFHGFTQLTSNRGSAYETWKASQWMDNLDMKKHFTIRDGTVTVKHSGLYYVYTQIYYQTSHDMSGYMVTREHVSFMRCTVTTYSSRDNTNTCFTAAVEHFEAGDQLRIVDLGGARTTYHDVDRSFFGLFRIGEHSARSSH